MDRIFRLPVGVAIFAALALAGMIGIFAFNAAQPTEATIAAVDVKASDTSASATGVDYTITFTETEDFVASVSETTSPGLIDIALPSGYTLDTNNSVVTVMIGSITLVEADDDFVPNIASGTITLTQFRDRDDTTGAPVLGYGANQEIIVTVSNVTNPDTIPSDVSWTVSTNSTLTAVSSSSAVADQEIPPPAPTITGVEVFGDDISPRATGVTYTIEFTEAVDFVSLGTEGVVGGAITITAPDGYTFNVPDPADPDPGDSVVTVMIGSITLVDDETVEANDDFDFVILSQEIYIYNFKDQDGAVDGTLTGYGEDQDIIVTVSKATNPVTIPTDAVWMVRTNSTPEGGDVASSGPATVREEPVEGDITGLDVKASNTDPGAEEVTYTIEFTEAADFVAQSTGGTSDGEIVITVPDGYMLSTDVTVMIGSTTLVYDPTGVNANAFTFTVNGQVITINGFKNQDGTGNTFAGYGPNLKITVTVSPVTNPATIPANVSWMVSTNVSPAMASPSDVADQAVQVGLVDPSVDARPKDPGAGAQITIKFPVGVALEADDTITFEVDDSFGVPGSISEDDVSITADVTTGGDDQDRRTASPRSVLVENNRPAERYKITLFVGNMDDSADQTEDKGIGIGNVTVTFRQGAGLTNRTEGGQDDWFFETSEEEDLIEITDVYSVPWIIELSDYSGSRGDEITAIGKGFKNGETTRFWRDADNDGNIDAGDDVVLCSAIANGDDIAECTFTLSNPPFEGGFGSEGNMNYINAVDGRNKKATDRPKIELEPSITIAPASGGPGDSINVQLIDLTKNDSVSRIELSRRDALCDAHYTLDDDDDTTPDETFPCGNFIEGTTNEAGTNGTLSFSFEIPNKSIQGNSLAPGIQDLRVFLNTGENVGSFDGEDINDDDKDVNLDLGVASGELQLTTTNVLPNQRISISGSGFTRSSSRTGDKPAFIGNPGSSANGCNGEEGEVTLGGKPIEPELINDDEGIEVTSGGTWAAPIDLPVDASTTVPGKRELRIVDCRGGEATVQLTFADREVTITPEEGGVGSELVITGKNFPVNNEHSNFDNEVEVIYEADVDRDNDDVDTDALGSFTLILQVPQDAIIPSNNTVKVQFTDDGDSVVLETFTHRIPQGTVAFSVDEGPENTTLTVEAKGFARYTSVDIIEFGDRDITPVPKPSTDTDGNTEIDIRIPGADPGIYIIRVEISDVVATHTFTVIEGGGVTDGEVETIVANVIAEDALESVFKFDNDSKAWQWFFIDEAFSGTNNLAGLSSGDLVWVKVKMDVMVEILGTMVSLSCINAGTDDEDCWNQVSIP